MPTIRVSEDLKKELRQRLQDTDDTYEGVIWGLLENGMNLSAKTKKEIAKSLEEHRQGTSCTMEEMRAQCNQRKKT